MKRGHSSRCAVIALCAGLGAACVARGSLRKDLYPPAPAKTAAARVSLLLSPGPPGSLRHWELPWASAELDLRGYPEAAAAMLGSLYGPVSLASSAASAQGADFIVLMATDYPHSVGLTFQDASGRVLAELSQPGWDVPASPEADSLLIKIITPPAMIVSMGTIGLGFYYRASEACSRISGGLSAATAKALSELRSRIAADPRLAPRLPAAPQ